MAASRSDPQTQQWKTDLAGKTIAIAAQTRAEVLYGARIANWGGERYTRLAEQLGRTATIPVNEDVIQAYVNFRAKCRAAGHPLQQKVHTGDLWVAATAIAIDASLLAVDGIYRGAPGLILL